MNEPNARAICDVKVTKDKDPYNVKMVKLLAEQLAASDKALNEAMERIKFLETDLSESMERIEYLEELRDQYRH